MLESLFSSQTHLNNSQPKQPSLRYQAKMSKLHDSYNHQNLVSIVLAFDCHSLQYPAIFVQQAYADKLNFFFFFLEHFMMYFCP